MSQPRFDKTVLSDVSWWHWTVTVPLLAAHLTGFSWAIEEAMVLCVAVGGYFYIRLRKLRPFPVQVRIAYFGLLLAGTIPGMQWVHWIQFFGTSAMVIVGYCPLIRMLCLLPFNREESLTGSYVIKVAIYDPCAGGLLAWTPQGGQTGATCCSLKMVPSTMSCSLPTRSSSKKEDEHAQAH